MAFPGSHGQPVNTAILPLNKGIFQDRPSKLVEAGAFWDIENFKVRDYSLARRGGFQPIVEAADIQEPIVDIFATDDRGQFETLLLTEERLFRFGDDGTLNELNLPITDASVTWGLDANNRITAVLTDITGLRSQVDVYEGSNFIGRIVSLSGNTAIISNDNNVTNVSGFGDFNSFDRWLGYKAWHASHTYLPGEYDKVIITGFDGQGLYEYNSTTDLGKFTLQALESAPSDIQHARVVQQFADRLWLGNVTVDGVRHKRRVYWSEPGLYETFSPLSFVDLPDSEGALVSMKALGNLLVLYFTDSIYIGRPTQRFGLPYAFEKFEASNLGLQSNRAVISWWDSHFLVLNDDIYRFSNSLALQPIGSQVKDLTVKIAQDNTLMTDVMISPDVENGDMLFFFPDSLNSADSQHGASGQIWRYHFRTSAWSKYKLPTDSVGNPRFYFTGVYSSYFYINQESWQDWIDLGNYSPEQLTALGEPYPTDGAAAWDGGDNLNWSDFRYWINFLGEADQVKNTFYGVTSGIQQGLYQEGNGGEDEIRGGNYGIVELLEASDVDFNLPDTDKTITRCSIKLLNNVDENIYLAFYTSNNRGRTWRLKGNWRVFTDEDEGRVDFLSTGTNFRFRLIGSDAVIRQPYELMEYVLRTAGRGLQTDDI